MAIYGGAYKERAVDAFQPVSDMLDVGRCEPLKAAVHGLLLVTVTVCAAYNSAAWLKRRQRHLAVNALIYGAAIWWERAHVLQHLVCEETVPPLLAAPADVDRTAGQDLKDIGDPKPEAA
jgi:hypothetical protein